MSKKLTLQLGKCYEFTLDNGKTIDLKLIGGSSESPLVWLDSACNQKIGDLKTILGSPYKSWKDVECWECKLVKLDD